MSAIAVVTSCSEEEWQAFGERNFRSLLDRMPSVDKFYVYVDFKLKFEDRRAAARRISSHCPRLVQYRAEATAYPFAPDLGGSPEKAFVVEHAISVAEEDLVFWIDIDRVATRDIRTEFLEWALPADALASCAASGAGPDCSVVGYNPKHPHIAEFVSLMADTYLTGSAFSLVEKDYDSVFALCDEYLGRTMQLSTHRILAGQSPALENSELGLYFKRSGKAS